MADFNIFFPILLQNEGYYSKDPDDTGGETWEGISRNNYPNWSGWVIVDSYKGHSDFPHVLRADENLANLVKAFYKPNFWDSIQGDNIVNQSIANFIADWGVNAGDSVPIRHTQELLEISVDGKVGPNTIEAINSATGPVFFTALQVARKQFYLELVAVKPTNKKFLSNWLERNASFSYKPNN